MRLRLVCLASLLYDALAFVAWTVIPIRAEGMGATPLTLGLLQTASTVVYVTCCLAVGRLADRWPKGVLARVGCAAGIAGCFAIGTVDTLGGIFASAALLGLGASVFWPAVQGAIGAETAPERMESALALFNFTWSLGKALGFVVAGWMMERHGPVATIWIAAAAAAPIVLFYPWGEGSRPAGLPASPRPERARFRAMGYAANFAAFGAGAAFQIHFFKFLEAGGSEGSMGRKEFFGLLMGAIFGAQTLSFLVFRTGAWWTYRRAPLYAAQVGVAAVCLAIPAAGNDLAALALALPLGAGLGFCYASSIYYSLHGPADHGKYAGLHEAALGTGSFLVPLAGGALAQAAGDLRLPYLLAALAMLGAVAVQERLYRTTPRS